MCLMILFFTPLVGCGRKKKREQLGCVNPTFPIDADSSRFTMMLSECDDVATLVNHEYNAGYIDSRKKRGRKWRKRGRKHVAVIS